MKGDNVIGTFLKDLLNQDSYEPPVAQGNYLGFFIPGGAVVLKRIEQLINGEPPAVAYSVAQLLQPHPSVKRIRGTNENHPAQKIGAT